MNISLPLCVTMVLEGNASPSLTRQMMGVVWGEKKDNAYKSGKPGGVITTQADDTRRASGALTPFLTQ